MGRAIVVMVSTLLFACLGLFIAWLNVQAVLANSQHGSSRNELITMSYAFGPMLGTGIGFTLSLFTIYLFTPQRKAA